MHTDVWIFYNGIIPKGFHIHHKDHNTWNNNIDNLELVEVNKHLSKHGKERFIKDKEWFNNFHSKGIIAAKEWHQSDEGKEWHKKHGKQSWVNRKYSIKICEQCKKEYKTRHSGISKYCHNNCKAKALRDRRKL
jgi:hypothetical protein